MCEHLSGAAELQDDVPREYDSIQVLFELPSVGKVWWPTTVLSSREHPNPGVVKGTGSVEYSSYQRHKKSVEDVQFLADRLVCTSAGETTWRTSAEAADAGEGDNMEAGWGVEKGSREQEKQSDAKCAGSTSGGNDKEPAQVNEEEETPTCSAERGGKRKRQKKIQTHVHT